MLALAHLAVLRWKFDYSQGVGFVHTLAHLAVLRWKVQSLSRSRLCACIGPPCCVEMEGAIILKEKAMCSPLSILLC